VHLEEEDASGEQKHQDPPGEENDRRDGMARRDVVMARVGDFLPASPQEEHGDERSERLDQDDRGNHLDWVLGIGSWLVPGLATDRGGFDPFEKPSAPAFSVYVEIRALCWCCSQCTRVTLRAGLTLIRF